MTRQPGDVLGKDSAASAHLDLIRGLAAFAVLWGHSRALFFTPYGNVRPTWVSRLFYFSTGFGHQSVMVFFVLSGYFIGSSVMASQRRRRFTWRNYLASRLTRLYSALLPGLLITALLDAIGTSLFGYDNVYGGRNTTILSYGVHVSSGLLTWIQNALFLQEITVRPFGSNGALWSLSYEFWYYVLFPVALFSLLPNTAVVARLCYIALAASLVIWLPRPILTYFGIWLLGYGTSQLRLPPRWPATFTHLSITIWMASLVTSRFTHTPWIDLVLGVTTAFLVYAILASSGPGVPSSRGYRFYTRCAKYLSEMSYTLYVVHLPLLCLVSAGLVTVESRWRPTAGNLGKNALLVAGVFVAARVVWALTEAHHLRLREAVLSTLARIWSRP